MDLPPRLAGIAREQPHPLVFATVSGAHLYGFPSPDSDWDLRGVHVLPARDSSLPGSVAFGALPQRLVELDRVALVGVVVHRGVGMEAAEDELPVPAIDAPGIAKQQLAQGLLVEEEPKLTLQVAHQPLVCAARKWSTLSTLRS
jgi:hypothetical protein